jgi:hypothetical protein
MEVSLGKLRRLASISMLGVLGTLLTLFYPTYMLLALFGIFALLTLARSLNFCKIAAMIRWYARVVSKLQFEIRLKLHMGFRDYGVAIEDDENRSHIRNCGFVR